jgi:peptidoglycan/xylan/chitin deacetylase (PgdA/CDA1 family)
MRAILTYHSIDPSGSPISLELDTFRRHADWLASGRVEVVPLEAILRVPPDRDAVAITFDDAFDNFAATAWPLLRERALPATLFVPTRRVALDNAWDDRAYPGIPTLPLAGWEALKRMASEGLALGSHSRTHAHLDRVSDAQLADEIAGSADDLERETGARPRAFCYPYGDHDERVTRAVASVYDLACTTELRVLSQSEDAHRLPRLDAFYYRAPGRLEAFGNGRFRRHLWLRAQARRIRSALTR